MCRKRIGVLFFFTIPLKKFTAYLIFFVHPSYINFCRKSANDIFYSNGKNKKISSIEKKTAKFAFSSVVSTKNILPGEKFTKGNIWVKRPGTGYFKAASFYKILGKKAKKPILKDNFIKKNDI